MAVTNCLWTDIYSTLTWQQKDGVSSHLCSSMCIPEMLGLKNLTIYIIHHSFPVSKRRAQERTGIQTATWPLRKIWCRGQLGSALSRMLRFKSTGKNKLKSNSTVDQCSKGITITILLNSTKFPLPFCKRNIPIWFWNWIWNSRFQFVK